MAPLSLSIPTMSGPNPLTLTLTAGEIIYIVGPNGSGKSALVLHLVGQVPAKYRRISAHRQTWLHSDASRYAPSDRRNMAQNIAADARSQTARYRDEYGDVRADLVLAELAAKEYEWGREFVAENRAKGVTVTEFEEHKPSLLGRLNDVLRLGALNTQVELHSNEQIVGRHPGSGPIGISKLSDGERNAILLATEVLTSETGSVLLIDEPERHLHRAIIEPLLTALFNARADCAFIGATHEISLPAASGDARTLVLRRCNWNGEVVSAFDVNILEPQSELPHDLRRAILGSRRQILFVEGGEHSLDSRLYQLLFHNVTIVPKGGHRTVIDAVEGLRSAPNLHWVHAVGLVDRDNRSAASVAELQAKGIYALQHCSVESLFFGSVARKAIANQQAKNLGRDAQELLDRANAAALESLDDAGVADRLCALRCESAARELALAQLKAADLEAGTVATIAVDTKNLFSAEKRQFAELRAAGKLDDLISRYQLRQTRCYSEIAKKLLFQKISHYQDAVIARVEHDERFARQMSALLEPLVTELN